MKRKGFVPPTLYNKAIQTGRIENLETLVEEWRMWQDDLLVNLTHMKDEELTRLKDTAEQEINVGIRDNVAEKALPFDCFIEKLMQAVMSLTLGYQFISVC